MAPDLIQWMNFVREEDEFSRKNYNVLTNDLITIVGKSHIDSRQKTELLGRLEKARVGPSTSLPDMLTQVAWILDPSIAQTSTVTDANPFHSFKEIKEMSFTPTHLPRREHTQPTKPRKKSIRNYRCKHSAATEQKTAAVSNSPFNIVVHTSGGARRTSHLPL